MAERRRYIMCICCLLFTAGIVAALFISIISATSTDAVYSVTITGVTGLDDPSTPAALAPVLFNLTVSIDNTGKLLPDEACVGRLSTVAVSYQDAPLVGHGPVPQFCAKQRKVRERDIRAWSQGVTLPQFLRDQLAGELAAGEAFVDVKVTTPAMDNMHGDTVLVCSDVKIGGGPARCRMESVRRQQQQQANPGSTN